MWFYGCSCEETGVKETKAGIRIFIMGDGVLATLK